MHYAIYLVHNLHTKSLLYNHINSILREEEPPKVENSDCDPEMCLLCRSRSSQLRDSCSNIDTLHGTQFYAMVVAHKPYREAKITFSGLNLREVTTFAQNELIR